MTSAVKNDLRFEIGDLNYLIIHVAQRSLQPPNSLRGQIRLQIWNQRPQLHMWQEFQGILISRQEKEKHEPLTFVASLESNNVNKCSLDLDHSLEVLLEPFSARVERQIANEQVHFGRSFAASFPLRRRRWLEAEGGVRRDSAVTPGRAISTGHFGLFRDLDWSVKSFWCCRFWRFCEIVIFAMSSVESDSWIAKSWLLASFVWIANESIHEKWIVGNESCWIAMNHATFPKITQKFRNLQPIKFLKQRNWNYKWNASFGYWIVNESIHKKWIVLNTSDEVFRIWRIAELSVQEISVF